MWATIYFAVHENLTILPKYGLHLLLYKRFVDDIFGIWVPADESPNNWANFKQDTNNFGILTWEFEEPSSEVNFLDLTIKIEGNTVTTKRG